MKMTYKFLIDKLKSQGIGYTILDGVVHINSTINLNIITEKYTELPDNIQFNQPVDFGATHIKSLQPSIIFNNICDFSLSRLSSLPEHFTVYYGSLFLSNTSLSSLPIIHIEDDVFNFDSLPVKPGSFIGGHLFGSVMSSFILIRGYYMENGVLS